MVVGEAKGGGIDQFGFSAAVVLGVLCEEVGDFCGVLGAEGAGRPGLAEVRGVFRCEQFGVPGHGHEEVDREFHRLQITDVCDPDSRGAVAVREVHLLPDFGDRDGVEPFIVSRTADVIEVVVDAGAAGA